MKKQILNIGKVLDKTAQKAVNGGSPTLSFCSGRFFCQHNCEEGDNCAFPSSSGGVIYGTIQNGVCCP